MRGAARRTWVAGMVAVVLGAGLADCAGGGSGGGDSGRPDRSGRAATAARACADGTFTWSGVTKRDRLTGVSEVQRIGHGGGRLENRLEPVYTPGPSVRADGPDVSAAEVLFSLGKKVGEIDSAAPTLEKDHSGTTYSFADPKATAPALESGFSRVDETGLFVTYSGVREVAGDFRYSCPGGRPTTGHARNDTARLNGLVSCDESAGKNALALQAARRSCAAGSAATKHA
ncbi:hypothetical protein [Streptomyces cellulosae]|uniref:Lipoprotein n=1 Tax=Streptomyces cellulosae TaxID=1968 RepID=A0ABW7XYH3_STRCE